MSTDLLAILARVDAATTAAGRGQGVCRLPIIRALERSLQDLRALRGANEADVAVSEWIASYERMLTDECANALTRCLVSILRPDRLLSGRPVDCTNGGLSSPTRAPEGAYVISFSSPVLDWHREASDSGTPVLRLRRPARPTTLCVDGSPVWLPELVPAIPDPAHASMVGPMFGGNYGTGGDLESLSGFRVPLRIWDRFDTVDDHRELTR